MYDLTDLWYKVEQDRLTLDSGHVGNVAYLLTDNYQWKLLPSLVSLLRYNVVDNVFLIMNTNKMAYTIPDNCHIIDVSEQKYFLPGSPNYGLWPSTTVLLRSVLCELLDVDRVINLDCDTIINGSLTSLYELDMTGYYFAMVHEANSGVFLTHNGLNYNIGVSLMNLEAIRRDRAQDDMVFLLNKLPLRCPEQDVVNLLYQDKTQRLVEWYNYSTLSASLDEFKNPVIIHYAGDQECYNDDSETWLRIYLDYYKLYIEAYGGVKLKDCLPVGEFNEI